MPYLNINQIELYYEIHGEGEPLLLITGLGGDAGYWSPVLARLSKHYKVIIFDNRGSGRSQAPDEACTLETLVNDTLGLLDHLGIQQTNIIGHSLGSMIAQYIAHYHPERVKKLVLYASSSRLSPFMRLGARFMVAVKLAKQQQQLTGKASGLLKMARLFKLDNTKHVLPVTNYNAAPESLTGYVHKARVAMGFDSRKWVGQITQPTLIIACGADKIFPIWHGFWLHKRIKISQLQVAAGAQHWFHLENPALFAEYVLKFLGTI